MQRATALLPLVASCHRLIRDTRESLARSQKAVLSTLMRDASVTPIRDTETPGDGPESTLTQGVSRMSRIESSACARGRAHLRARIWVLYLCHP